MAFISSHGFDRAGNAVVTDGILCPIPGRCKKCGLYKNGACTDVAGMGQCRVGYTVYFDEHSRRLFFGTRVEGLHDRKRVTNTKVPVYLTQRQFATLICYDSCKADHDQIESMVGAFSEQYDEIIRRIKTALPRYDGESLVHMRPEEVENISNAVDALDELKRSTETFVFKHTPYLLFPSVGGREETVFQGEEICRTCISRECEKRISTEKFSCHMCQNGCSFCIYQHRRFYGLRIVGYYRKSLCRSSTSRKLLSRFEPQQIQGLITAQVRQNEVLLSIRRFLHDIGQYLFGMANLTPRKSAGAGVVTCSAADIRSIAAFTSALKSLKREFFKDRNPMMATVRRTFEPFPLFYKYRLCFECKDVKIDVKDQNQMPGSHEHESIEGPVGFEFVALNLLSNAVKYLPRTDAQHRKISIVHKKDTQGLHIEVSSWGPRVAKDELPFLGERGFRSKDARKADISGQGLGLSRILAYMRVAHFEIKFYSDDEIVNYGGVQYSPFRVCISIPSVFCKGVGGNAVSDISSAMSFE